MKLVPIDLESVPVARLVTHHLVASKDLGCLSGDLVFIELPNSVSIDISWYPEHDPSGSYVITMFKHGDWDHPLLQAKTEDPEQAARNAKSMAVQHIRGSLSPDLPSQSLVVDYDYPVHSPELHRAGMLTTGSCSQAVSVPFFNGRGAA